MTNAVQPNSANCTNHPQSSAIPLKPEEGGQPCTTDHWTSKLRPCQTSHREIPQLKGMLPHTLVRMSFSLLQVSRSASVDFNQRAGSCAEQETQVTQTTGSQPPSSHRQTCAGGAPASVLNGAVGHCSMGRWASHLSSGSSYPLAGSMLGVSQSLHRCHDSHTAIFNTLA